MHFWLWVTVLIIVPVIVITAIVICAIWTVSIVKHNKNLYIKLSEEFPNPNNFKPIIINAIDKPKVKIKLTTNEYLLKEVKISKIYKSKEGNISNAGTIGTSKIGLIYASGRRSKTQYKLDWVSYKDTTVFLTSKRINISNELFDYSILNKNVEGIILGKDCRSIILKITRVNPYKFRFKTYEEAEEFANTVFTIVNTFNLKTSKKGKTISKTINNNEKEKTSRGFERKIIFQE